MARYIGSRSRVRYQPDYSRWYLRGYKKEEVGLGVPFDQVKRFDGRKSSHDKRRSYVQKKKFFLRDKMVDEIVKKHLKTSIVEKTISENKDMHEQKINALNIIKTSANKEIPSKIVKSKPSLINRLKNRFLRYFSRKI